MLDILRKSMKEEFNFKRRGCIRRVIRFRKYLESRNNEGWQSELHPSRTSMTQMFPYYDQGLYCMEKMSAHQSTNVQKLTTTVHWTYSLGFTLANYLVSITILLKYFMEFWTCTVILNTPCQSLHSLAKADRLIRHFEQTTPRHSFTSEFNETW